MSKIKVPSTKELLDAGVHFGHQTRRWHPAMEQHIYAVKKNIHIIDLEQTEKKLKEACEFLYKTASEGGQIIFVGTKRQAREMVEIEAKRCGALYVTERWIGGTISNYAVVKKNMDKLVDYMRKRETGEFGMYTKKERLLIDREIEKLQRNVGGIVGLRSVPAALFIIDARREKTAIREGSSAGVKIAGLVDTNTNPEKIDYVVPGNDDAIKSVALVLKTVGDAIEAGYQEYDKKVAKGKEVPVEAELPTEETLDAVPLKVSGDESFISSEDAGKKLVSDVVIEDSEDVKADVTSDLSEVKAVEEPKKATKKVVKKVTKKVKKTKE
jgi:small subunit ribosomal protein S2